MLDPSRIHRLTPADDRYPPLLREIADPPPLLYAVGRIELLQRPHFAIVGSRNATVQGSADAEAFARALSDMGFVIASGLALGIDAAAHRGGLAGASSSVAVVGTGIDVTYPRRNATLTEELRTRGCVLSELPLGTPPAKGNFPRRNRLISGLSRGVLVVEAAQGSGSLRTVESALQQNREVFAMPGSIHSPLSKGCHGLIKEGAKSPPRSEIRGAKATRSCSPWAMRRSRWSSSLSAPASALINSRPASRGWRSTDASRRWPADGSSGS